jgi:hypothetical protein
VRRKPEPIERELAAFFVKNTGMKRMGWTRKNVVLGKSRIRIAFLLNIMTKNRV